MMHVSTYFVLFFCIFLGGNAHYKKDSLLVDNNDIKYSQESVFVSNIDTLSILLSKLEKKESLNRIDFNFMVSSILRNEDESVLEGLGYLIFEYLKGSKTRNELFESYLNNWNNKRIGKEDVKQLLIKIMCVDIGFEEYNYKEFITDFQVFRQSDQARDGFNKCLANFR